MPTEKISEFRSPFATTHKTRQIVCKGYWRFSRKFEAVDEIPKGSILVTADVFGLFPSIPHDGGFEVLWKQYNKFKVKLVATEDIIKMVDFVFKNNLFEFDCKFYQ